MEMPEIVKPTINQCNSKALPVVPAAVERFLRNRQTLLPGDGNYLRC